MPVAQPKPNYPPEPPRGEAAPVPRLASGGEDPVFSPVHAMQQELLPLTAAKPAVPEALYPLWLRVAIIGGSSALAWGLIIWGASRLG